MPTLPTRRLLAATTTRGRSQSQSQSHAPHAPYPPEVDDTEEETTAAAHALLHADPEQGVSAAADPAAAEERARAHAALRKRALDYVKSLAQKKQDEATAAAKAEAKAEAARLKAREQAKQRAERAMVEAERAATGGGGGGGGGGGQAFRAGDVADPFDKEKGACG